MAQAQKMADDSVVTSRAEPKLVGGWSSGYNPGGTLGFSVHPAELRRRRSRCEPIVKSLLEIEREFVAACNVCGSERSAIVAQPDRYGFPARTAMCLGCGLYYLVDRFTARGYAEFYGNGSYRTLASSFSGAKQGIEQIHADQTDYARRLIASLVGYLNFGRGANLLDIGGSAGKVALEFQKFFGFRATVLDPATEEIAAARNLGLEGITESFEDWYTDEQFDVVLFCRSIEHVQDLRGVLAKIRRLLRPNGLLYCDIVDFTELCRLVGHPEAVTKIDHCYWLTQETAVNIFSSAGLEVVSVNISLAQPLVGFLLRPCEPSLLLTADPVWIHTWIRHLQETASEWQNWGHDPVDATDWLRRKAYRVKRRLATLLS